MKIKNLTRRQIRWTFFLLKFNFKIQYQIKSRNVKVDVLTRMFDFILVDFNDERRRYQHQIILTSNRLKIRSMKFDSKTSLYDRMLKVNKNDENCFRYRQTIKKNRKTLHDVKLKICTIKNEILWHDDQLWVFDNVTLLLKLIRESHDLFVCDHLDVTRIVEIFRRYYYWFNIHKIVKQYVRNCRIYNRFKVFLWDVVQRVNW